MGGTIFYYSIAGGSPAWGRISLPQGTLGELATDGNDLYALVFPSGEPLNASAVRRYNLSSNSWDANYSLNGYSIQSLYGTGNKIFAGAQHYSNYQNFGILYLDFSLNSFTVVKYGTSLLKGAALGSDGIYLATAGDGLLLFNESSLTTSQVGNSAGVIFTGLTNLAGTLIAVTGDGAIYYNGPGGFSQVSTGVSYTGAMCVWQDRKNQWRPSLLLLGVRGSSSTHGYQEMILNNGTPTFSFKTPGDGTPTSVANKAKYEASIRTHPVESILQLADFSSGGPIHYRDFTDDPEWEPPIFASTSMNGLWSYRNGEWNAED